MIPGCTQVSIINEDWDPGLGTKSEVKKEKGNHSTAR
jgi:hypothetical protein